MMRVYVHTRVEKDLLYREEQENTPAFAAKKRAERIIHSLAEGTKPSRAGKLSQNGDARIKKCLKYDLGKGYRLVCVKDKKAIYVLYTGSHDSCNTWLDKNRNLKIKAVIEYLNLYWCSRLSEFRMNCGVVEKEGMADQISMETDYDDMVMGKITQKDLREVFQGLVQ